MRIAVIGLGEAGAVYAAACAAAGHLTTGYDPVTAPPAGVGRGETGPDAVRDADLVIVLTSASLSATIAADLAPHLATGAVYADFTTAAPDVMVDVAAVVESRGARFADVAILGPVPLQGARTGVIVSGSGAAAVSEVLGALGAPVEFLDGPAGDATSHKLLRSVFMKGLALVVCEAVAAGRAAGAEDWIRAQIASQLAGDGTTMLDRFITGSSKHAVRRAHEMESVVAFLDHLGVPSDMSAASRHALERLALSPS